MGGGASELPLPLYGAFQCLKGFLVAQDLGNKCQIGKASKCVYIYIYICLQISKMISPIYARTSLQAFKGYFVNAKRNRTCSQQM